MPRIGVFMKMRLPHAHIDGSLQKAQETRLDCGLGRPLMVAPTMLVLVRFFRWLSRFICGSVVVLSSGTLRLR